MTGITKDELMQMAREAGFQTAKVDWLDGADTYPLIRTIGENCNVAITNLINIVLEHAAVRLQQASEQIDAARLEMLSKDAEAYEDAYERGAEIVRALKINTGD